MPWMTRTFVRGLAALLPLGLTVYLLFWAVSSMETLLEGLYTRLFPQGVYRYGIGVALAIVVVFFVGMLLNLFLVRRLYDAAVKQVKRIPLVKSLFGMLQDMMGFFTMSERRGANQVVMVEFGGARLIGFVTRETFADLPGVGDADTVGVYLPMSYQLGGYLVMVPRRAVQRVPLSVEQAMRFAVTAGVSTGAKSVAHAPRARKVSKEAEYQPSSDVFAAACAREPSSSS